MGWIRTSSELGPFRVANSHCSCRRDRHIERFCRCTIFLAWRIERSELGTCGRSALRIGRPASRFACDTAGRESTARVPVGPLTLVARACSAGEVLARSSAELPVLRGNAGDAGRSPGTLAGIESGHALDGETEAPSRKGGSSCGGSHVGGGRPRAEAGGGAETGLLRGRLPTRSPDRESRRAGATTSLREHRPQAIHHGRGYSTERRQSPDGYQ